MRVFGISKCRVLLWRFFVIDPVQNVKCVCVYLNILLSVLVVFSTFLLLLLSQLLFSIEISAGDQLLSH